MLSKRWHVIVGVALISILAACAPKPIPAPNTPSAVTEPAKPTAAAATVSPKDVAWNKVVEAAKLEGTVNFYTYEPTGDRAMMLARAFQDRYGIKLEFITGVGNFLFERIKSENVAKKNYGDAFSVGISLLALTKQEGLTEKVDELPVFTDKDAWIRGSPIVDPEEHIVSLRPVILTPFVNTTLLRAGEEPKSYKELLEPRWKSKMIFDSPAVSPSANWVYIALRKGEVLGDEYWRQLGGQELKLSASVFDALSSLSRGESPVFFSTGDSTAAATIREGAPIKPIEMLEGVVVVPAGVGMVRLKNAPHPNAARVLMNWLLSPEGQTKYAEALGGFSPIRKDVADIRLAVLRLTPKKVLVLDFADMLEGTKLQREGTVVKLMGLQK